MRLLLLAGILAASAALVGCGSDSSAPPSSSPSSTSPTTAPAASTEAATKDVDTAAPSTAAPTSTAPARGPQRCAQQRDVTIKIVLGDLDCATAYGVAFQVDRDGDKRQDVDTYVCEFGNATIRPTIFSCTDNANGTEFSVDEA